MSFARLAGKTAVVTGSSTGIGQAVAFALYTEGAQVVCADLEERRQGSEDTEVPTHEQINKAGGKAIFVQTDVTRADSVKRLVKEAVSHFGRIDIFINNAGVTGQDGSIMLSNEAWDRNFAINARGTSLGCKYAGAQMKKQDQLPSMDRGWIINIAGVQTGSTGESPSKHSLVTDMTQTIAQELRDHDIHVNAITPGYTKMSMPENGLETEEALAAIAKLPEDVAKMVVQLATEESGWMAGNSVSVDSGNATF
ncbi:Short-chain dehydrogenase/reductase SDR [Lasiodiplodia theobromae]|uniref:Short-chain dehydrogenase/reductase SDR n=1 Tax=Lasiodiplodia theobromae TaxID=45133 RepID=UPI0015C395C6|nr:Short-chain dehydrogenase/reductase SDR [Lasiodiplodia theobromae]KAF4533848.1 Short-chain dehydrogenase/reductase SDR [Lasiodiplodia theobromae]KAF9638140.1 Short-chain dehydrogenase/reductase SDR [Lasiodiplodia theobromae]